MESGRAESRQTPRCDPCPQRAASRRDQRLRAPSRCVVFLSRADRLKIAWQLAFLNVERPTPNAERPINFCIRYWTLYVGRSTFSAFYARNRRQTAGANFARARLGIFQ